MNLTEHVFKQEAVILALKKLFSDNYFDVTSLNRIALLADIIIPSDKQKLFNTLHCVHYNTMSREFREDLAETIQNQFEEYFEIESHKIQFTEIVREIEYKKK